MPERLKSSILSTFHWWVSIGPWRRSCRWCHRVQTRVPVGFADWDWIDV